MSNRQERKRAKAARRAAKLPVVPIVGMGAFLCPCADCARIRGDLSELELRIMAAAQQGGKVATDIVDLYTGEQIRDVERAAALVFAGTFVGFRTRYL